MIPSREVYRFEGWGEREHVLCSCHQLQTQKMSLSSPAAVDRSCILTHLNKNQHLTQLEVAQPLSSVKGFVLIWNFFVYYTTVGKLTLQTSKTFFVDYSFNHPSIICTAHPVRVVGGLENIPPDIWWEVEYTLYRSPEYHRANIQRQKTIHSHTYGQLTLSSWPSPQSVSLWTVGGNHSTEKTQTRGEHAIVA